MAALLCVGMGGFLGAACRYGLGLLPYQGEFPLITFAINFLGAFLIGFVTEIANQREAFPSNLLLFLKTGLCGGFTTFSTFSLETLQLLDRGQYAIAGAYAVVSVVLCLLGVVFGRLFASAVAGAQG